MAIEVRASVVCDGCETRALANVQLRFVPDSMRGSTCGRVHLALGLRTTAPKLPSGWVWTEEGDVACPRCRGISPPDYAETIEEEAQRETGGEP